MPSFRQLIPCLLFLLAWPCFALDSYHVSYVFDGDTVELTNAESKIKLRLADIDAPERQQAFGQKARRALIALCKGNNIEIAISLTGMDQYARHLGRMQCNQTDASVYMAEQGLAWYNEKYSDNAAVKQAAASARSAGIGLWSDAQSMPPWVWRRLYGNKTNSKSQPGR